MAKQISKMLEQQNIADLNRIRAETEVKARTALQAFLEVAKHDQTEALAQGEKLVSVDTLAKKTKGSFLGSMVAVFAEAKKQSIPVGTAASLLDAELGNPDTLGDSKAASTIKTHRSTAKNFGFVLYQKDYEAIAAGAGVTVRDKEGKEINPETFTTKEMRAVINAYSTDAERVIFDQMLSRLTKEIKNSIKSRAKNDDKGIVALEPLPIADVTAWLSKVLASVPQRPLKSSVEAGVANAETLSTALEQSDESTHAAQEDQDDDQGVERVA